MRNLKILILLIIGFIIVGCTNASPKMITISYVTNSGEHIENLKIEADKEFELPILNRVGYVFVNWKDSNSTVYSGKVKFTQDITLYAYWSKAKYSVKFVDFDDKLIEEQFIEYLEDATKPENPIKVGYSFVGWDIEFTKISKDIVVKAIYEESTQGLEFKLVDNEYYIVTGYNGTSENVVIPTNYNGLPVTEINQKAFYKKDIESVKIPSSITIIGNNAFSECRFLSQISIPSSVLTIGQEAFSDCSSLTKVNIAAKNIGESAFLNCNRLYDITLTNDVEIISSYAFFAATDLISLNIPLSVNSIGDHFISWCQKFTTLSTDVDNVSKVQNMISNITLIYINNFNKIVTSNN